MIGNDIVDLKFIKTTTNWQRPRFLNKVFTEKEQQFILSSEDQHQMVWLLWSMKEAAYKVHVQQFRERFFNPKRIVCKPFSRDFGCVTIDHNSYFTTSIITEAYVYTIANQKSNTTTIHSKILKTDNGSHLTQSNTLKATLKRSISNNENMVLEDLLIVKTMAGVPKICYKSITLPTSISLTHCGRFSGFVYK